LFWRLTLEDLILSCLVDQPVITDNSGIEALSSENRRVTMAQCPSRRVGVSGTRRWKAFWPEIGDVVVDIGEPSVVPDLVHNENLYD
jgi:hypothetical protein